MSPDELAWEVIGRYDASAMQTAPPIRSTFALGFALSVAALDPDPRVLEQVGHRIETWFHGGEA